MSDLLLAGRVAVVTGGESGIGAACVAELAKAGADIGILYHGTEEDARKSAAAAEAAGRRTFLFKGDVGVEADVEAMFDGLKQAIGTADILVNSAGLNMSGVNVADMSLEQWDRLLRTDLTGSFLTARRFVRDLRGSGRPGAVINITSIHSSVMRAGGADYDAAKGGQTNLTKTLAIEVAADGITVNAIAPGMILTPMNKRAETDEAYRQGLERSIPVKRAGKPEEIGHVAVFLASSKASYITGSTITVDGGLSLELGQGA